MSLPKRHAWLKIDGIEAMRTNPPGKYAWKCRTCGKIMMSANNCILPMDYVRNDVNFDCNVEVTKKVMMS